MMVILNIACNSNDIYKAYMMRTTIEYHERIEYMIEMGQHIYVIAIYTTKSEVLQEN